MAKKKEVKKLYYTYPKGEFVLSESQSLPSDVAGQSAKYYWKDLISVGKYIDANGTEVSATPDQLKHWAKEGNAMLGGGIEIPIQTNHDWDCDPRDTMGWLKDFKIDGDKLMGLCQIVGDENQKVAAVNRVSIGVMGKYEDGKGREWGDVIRHVCVTPNPAVPNQEPFQYVFSENINEGEAPDNEEQNDMKSLTCSDDCLSSLHKLVPGLKDIPDENKLTHVVGHLHTLCNMASEDAGEPADSAMSQTIIDKANANRLALREKAKNAITPFSEDAKEMAASAISTKLDVALSKGAIDPKTKSALLKVFGDSAANINVLALSKMEDGKSLAIKIVDALAENKPFVVGEKTGAQVMPNTAVSESAELVALKEHMKSKVSSAAGTATATNDVTAHMAKLLSK